MDFKGMTDEQLAAIGYQRTKGLVKRRVGQGAAITGGIGGVRGAIAGAAEGGRVYGGKGAVWGALGGAGLGAVLRAPEGAIYGAAVGGIQQSRRRGAQLEMIRRGKATASKFEVAQGMLHAFEAASLKSEGSGILAGSGDDWLFPRLDAHGLEKPLKLAEQGRAVISYALRSTGTEYTQDGPKHRASLAVYDIEEVPEMQEGGDEFATWGSPRDFEFGRGDFVLRGAKMNKSSRMVTLPEAGGSVPGEFVRAIRKSPKFRGNGMGVPKDMADARQYVAGAVRENRYLKRKYRS